MAAEAEHERVAAGLARLAAPPPDLGADVLAYLGLNPGSVEARALVLLCRRYNLDPLLGHASIIVAKGGAKAYITRDGMLEIAHRSHQLDGIVVDEERESDHGWSATVSVYRKDMAHPFTYKGGCGREERQAREGNGAEMALARAERRALRRAFAIPADDVYDDEIPVPAAPLEEHRVVGQVDRTGRLICACGELFDTAWQFGAHRNAHAPLPPVQPAVTPGDSPHKAAELAGKPKKDVRRDQSPPPEFYDDLPEAQRR